MAMKKIKKNDVVRVMTGRDKGKEGRVLEVKDRKVLVEGVATVTKHTKASQGNPKGGIVHQEAMIDASNVMYVVGGKVSRIGFRIVNGKKVRYAKATGEVID